ncbi:MAG TPA: carboxypeptidase-like regulatory domain-containing protein, partial [Verrucomicrobiae bacterium]|nr:carboxypeptidase-like regulatory domain-containing protein [Verrucomicrobiae bacterium]
MRRKPAILLLAFAAIVFISPAVRAQQVAVAQLDGYVTDPSGQAIVGAQVRATELSRSQVREGNTDSLGHYQFPGLPAGEYQLEIRSSGFKTYVQKGIILDAGNNRTQSVTLEVGAVT